MSWIRSALALAGLACTVSVAPAAGSLSVTSDLEGARVVVTIPADTVAVGDTLELSVLVEPAAGRAAPRAVRARLGMPDHGHWVTREESRPFRAGEPVRYPGDFPMTGRYRFRVWVEFPDGAERKTAVDLVVQPGEPLDPRAVP